MLDVDLLLRRREDEDGIDSSIVADELRHTGPCEEAGDHQTVIDTITELAGCEADGSKPPGRSLVEEDWKWKRLLLFGCSPSQAINLELGGALFFEFTVHDRGLETTDQA